MESSFRYQIQWRMLIREKGNTFFLTTKPASNQPKIKTPDAWVPGVRAPSRLALAEGVQPQHGDDATTQTRKSHPPLSLALQSPPNSPLPLAPRRESKQRAGTNSSRALAISLDSPSR